MSDDNRRPLVSLPLGDYIVEVTKIFTGRRKAIYLFEVFKSGIYLGSIEVKAKNKIEAIKKYNIKNQFGTPELTRWEEDSERRYRSYTYVRLSTKNKLSKVEEAELTILQMEFHKDE